MPPNPAKVSPLMSQASPPSSVPAPLVAFAAWLVPGSGYWLIGQRARAVTIGLTIVLVFLLGLLVGGVRVVDVPDVSSGDPLHHIAQKPWFIGQILGGGVSLVSAWFSNRLAADPVTANLVSHSRNWEIGTLYTAVAGMLNLLAVIDASFRASHPPAKESA